MKINHSYCKMKRKKGILLALLDNDKSVLPLSSIAELLNAKVRTLKSYEEKMLFPLEEGNIKKLYSINDIKIISFVYYLASVKRINANGIKYILDILDNNMDETNRASFLEIVEKKMETLSGSEIKDVEID